MSDSGSSPQAIANLITHLRQVGLDLSAAEMADALWLTLEIRKWGSTSSALADPIELVQTEVELIEQIVVERELVSPPTQGLPSVPLVMEQPQDQTFEERSGAALPIAIPAASALPQAMQISRSLRPLMRKIKSRSRQMFDEEATVVQIVDQEIWSPVMQAAPERWLELAIVVEETSVFEVWQDTIAEFQQLMERHGAFRDVRAWQLVSDGDESARLFRRKLAGIDRSQLRQPGELLDPTGRRLIWFVSDCTSAGWRSGAVPDLLEQWMKHNPVTVLQLLPGRFWDRSTLGWGYPVWLGATEPGLLNDRLIVEGLPKKRNRRKLTEDGSNSLEQPLKQRARLTLPVVTLDPLSLGQWAKMMVGNGDPLTAGVVLDLNELAEYAVAYAEEKQQEIESVTPEELVQRFRGTASPLARRLAEMMAAVPVSWSVIRLIQKNLLPKANTVHVAEIFLGGLLRLVQQPSDGANSRVARSRYQFDPAVRQLLIEAVPVYATEGVMEKVAEDALSRLPDEIRQQLSEDIARRLGRSPRSFEAFLVPELLTNLQLEDETRLELLPFAEVGCEVLQWMGGEYAAIANQITRVPIEPTSPIAPHPSDPEITSDLEIKVLDFKTARFLDPESGISAEDGFPPIQTEPFTITTISIGSINPQGESQPHNLQSFEFTVATLQRSPTQPKRQKKQSQPAQWIIQRQQQSAYHFFEPLTIPGDVLLEMVSIPGGTFLMGSPEDEPDRRPHESPQHEVTLEPFSIGRYPITQLQWEFVANLMPQVNRELQPNPSRFKGSNHPVEKVSWYDAIEFCDRLNRFIASRSSQSAERIYRLPSEAEWEYACRAGTTTPFHFGETITPELVNYRGTETYNNSPKGEYRATTTPVDHFEYANAWGLSDMHGNVYEWCEDYWHNNYEGAPTNGSAWLSENKGETRVRRGGSWYDNPVHCRSANRFNIIPRETDIDIGFRIVCSFPRILP